MKDKKTSSANIPIAGLAGLIALIFTIAYLGAIAARLSHSLMIGYDSLIWWLSFPVLLIVGPFFYLIDHGHWSPLLICGSAIIVSLFGFWIEGKNA